MNAWAERKADESAVAALVAAGEQQVFARILALRGVTPETLAVYRSPRWSDVPEPEGLPGIVEAADAVLAALRAGRKIVVFGDYDCDGVCATAILVLVLRRLATFVPRASCLADENTVHDERSTNHDARSTKHDALSTNIAPFIPSRLTEGYGLSDASVTRMLAENPDVSMVLTVDNGVNAVEQIADLRAKGISVVVTDHHLPGETLPDADVLVDPKVASPKELEELCGAAVAYFLARRLFRIVRDLTGRDDVAGGLNGQLLEMAALATVTDIMPLVGVNRTLVFNALRDFRIRAPLGLRTLYERSARIKTDWLNAKDFGCLIGPRINAVGRLGSGSQALDLLLCFEGDNAEADRLVAEIEKLNDMRREVEMRMTSSAFEQHIEGDGAQVIALSSEAGGENVHSGVAGIVASRLMDRLRPSVPVCVLVDGKGSARAPQGYNIRDALAECSQYLDSFGGHAAAAGLAVREGCIDAFREAFRNACIAQAKTLEERGEAKTFDAAVAVDDVNDAFAREVDALGPYGEGNPEPVFCLRGLWLDLSGLRRRGADGAHLQIAFRQKSLPRIVWRGHGDMEDVLRSRGETVYDMLFMIRVIESDYGGAYPLINVVDLKRVEES